MIRRSCIPLLLSAWLCLVLCGCSHRTKNQSKTAMAGSSNAASTVSPAMLTGAWTGRYTDVEGMTGQAVGWLNAVGKSVGSSVLQLNGDGNYTLTVQLPKLYRSHTNTSARQRVIAGHWSVADQTLHLSPDTVDGVPLASLSSTGDMPTIATKILTYVINSDKQLTSVPSTPSSSGRQMRKVTYTYDKTSTP